MSTINRKEMLMSYLETNVSPVLLDDCPSLNLENATVIPSNIDISELNGYYEGINFVPPKWFQEMLIKKSKFLIIDKLTDIPKNEQKKFVEILKYKKVSVFELPRDLIIVITSNKIENNIDEEIYSLVAVI